MKPDPDHAEYCKRWAAVYDNSNYDKGLAAYFMRGGHAFVENQLSRDRYFPLVLEVGAGSGAHYSFVKHKFDHYLMTDNSDFVLAAARHRNCNSPPKFECRVEDAAKLSFEDASFDRLIATHVLEHMSDPHVVLREWARVVRPGGLVSLLLPCDPGVAWRLGRHFGPRASATRAGIPYDYWMAREHVNSITNLVAFVRYYFDSVQESWYPFHIPSVDLNLFYACHIVVA